MSDVLRVDEHPHGCTVCMAVAGPFVVYKVAGYTVQTVEGPLVVDTEFALCARTDGREGCAGQGARMDGYVAPDEHENVVRQYTEALESHAAAEAKLAALEKAEALDRKTFAKEVAEEIISAAGG